MEREGVSRAADCARSEETAETEDRKEIAFSDVLLSAVSANSAVFSDS